jgi:hypothetical protein
MLSEFVSVIWQFLFVGSRFCALICLIGFSVDSEFCSSFLEFLFPLNFSPIFLKFAGSG